MQEDETARMDFREVFISSEPIAVDALLNRDYKKELVVSIITSSEVTCRYGVVVP